MKSIPISLFFSTFLITVLGDKVVRTKYGTLQGFDYQTESGRLAEIFLGIPYAQAPVDNLRFEVSFGLGRMKINLSG